MISIFDLGRKDSTMMTTAVAISHCRLRPTRDARGTEDGAAEMLPVSPSIAVRPDNQI